MGNCVAPSLIRCRKCGVAFSKSAMKSKTCPYHSMRQAPTSNTVSCQAYIGVCKTCGNALSSRSGCYHSWRVVTPFQMRRLMKRQMREFNNDARWFDKL